MQFSTTLNRSITASPAVGASHRQSVALWTVQGILAAVFLFAGGMKLVSPSDALADQSDLPVLFMRFVGLCEFLGAAGLILPGVLHIRPRLTPLAAAGLVGIMIGATVVTIGTMGAAPAVMPFAVGILAATIAYSRTRRPSPSR